MKNLLTKWLAALLAAMLLLSPVALMEELEPAAEAPAEVVEAVEPAEPAAEDAGEDAEPAADDELILDTEEEVAEETDVDLVDAEEAVEEYAEYEEEFVSFDAMNGALESTPNYVIIKPGENNNGILYFGPQGDDNYRVTCTTDPADTANPNTTVTVTLNWGTNINPENLKVEAYYISDGNRTDLTVNKTDNYTYTFTMPGSHVYINVTQNTVIPSYDPNAPEVNISYAEGGSSFNVSSVKEAISMFNGMYDNVTITSISIRNLDDLTGLEGLTSIEGLNIYNSSSASKVDFSKFTKLTWLSVFNCGITSIDVSSLSQLEGLDVSNNKLTALDVSKNSKLKELYAYKNTIAELDIVACPELLSLVNDQYRIKEAQVKERFGDNVIAFEKSGEDDSCYCLVYDSSTKLITSHPAPAPAPAPIPTITATKKNQKCTIKAAPGSVYQLDLGGKTAKSFKSSKKKVATVDKNGLVTVKKAGKTTITIKISKKKTRKVKLNIKDPTIPTSVTLPVASKAVKKGDVITLTPVIPAGTNSTFKWKSSNKRVATVNNGVVTFKKKGKVTITCTAVRGKKKRKVTFKVSPQ